MKQANNFSILCDEVTDISKFEQVSIGLRFVDRNNDIREEFLDFKQAERITGRALASILISALEEWDLDIQHLRGQGYDGASNMSASKHGVQGIITELTPLTLYVHCHCHVLNLVIVTSCSLPVVQNMSGTITELSNLFVFSPKRQRMFTNVIALETPDQIKTS